MPSTSKGNPPLRTHSTSSAGHFTYLVKFANPLKKEKSRASIQTKSPFVHKDATRRCTKSSQVSSLCPNDSCGHLPALFLLPFSFYTSLSFPFWWAAGVMKPEGRRRHVDGASPQVLLQLWWRGGGRRLVATAGGYESWKFLLGFVGFVGGSR